MSGKIKSKDLSYDSTLPPFLQRLRAQNTGSDADPDRHERQTVRPRKAKNPDEDDGPTVVDESGENISKDDYARLTRVEADEEDVNGIVTGKIRGDSQPEVSGALPAEANAAGGKQGEGKVTDGAVTKKRKVGKVVGDGEGNEQDGTDGQRATSDAAKAPKKAKKKLKPIKLAFDDEQG